MAMLHMMGRMASLAQEPTIDPAQKLTTPSGSVVCHVIHGPGGTKKFLYTGPKKRGSGFDGDEEQKQFSYTNTNYNSENTGNPSFDFDDVWSIKKNVNVSKQNQKQPGNKDGWSMNVNRGFYSRHGGLNGEKNSEETGNTTNPGGKSWGQQKTYSYSYGEQGRESQASSTEANNSPRGSNPGRYGVQNPASQNNKFSMNNF